MLIRFQIDRGLIVIPKSVTKSRIEENFQIWDFQLSPEDIKLLESLECNGRVCTSSELSDHP
ncbi:aldo/keto reductase, partial [Vibrio parahaemolyticus]